jgi:hypothetical protein
VVVLCAIEIGLFMAKHIAIRGLLVKSHCLRARHRAAAAPLGSYR